MNDTDPDLVDGWSAGWWLLVFTLAILFGWAVVTLVYLRPLA